MKFVIKNRGIKKNNLSAVQNRAKANSIFNSYTWILNSPLSILFFLLPVVSLAQIDALVATEMKPAIAELRDFISVANDAVNPADIKKNIEWADKAFAKRGFKTSLVENDSLPLFIAEKIFAKDLKTVMFYFHIDGQPVRPSEWSQKDPYISVLKENNGTGEFKAIDWEALQTKLDEEWRIYGRSTSDDKGPVIMFLHAFDMMQAKKQTPAFNIKIVLDPEEEKGSTGLKTALEKYKERFAADYLIVMDGPMHSSNIPTLTFGNRGGAGFSITTYGALTQLHSGHYGNYSPDPSFRLSKIIASMKDDQGRVLIKGFYDGITLDEETKKVLAAVPDNRQEINARLVIAEEEKVGANYQESLQYPSLTIQGMRAAVVGKGSGSIIPEESIAVFGIRLVPESDGARLVGLVKKHIEKLGYTVLDHPPTNEERLKYPQIVYFNGRAGSPAFRTEINSPMGTWLRKAMKDNFGKDPIIIRIMGGSVPIVPFVQALKIPAVLVPLVNVDNNQHSPNENLRLGNMATGMKVCWSILTSKM